MNKKAQKMLFEQIFKLGLGIVAVLILLYAGFVLFQTYFGNQEELQAKGTLGSLVTKIHELEKNPETPLLLESPVGWYIIAFDSSHNKNGVFTKPQMIQPNIVCICNKKCETEFCRAIDLPLKYENELANLRISIIDIWLINQIDYYEISLENPYPEEQNE